jgi:hypothetical protein
MFFWFSLFCSLYALHFYVHAIAFNRAKPVRRLQQNAPKEPPFS